MSANDPYGGLEQEAAQRALANYHKFPGLWPDLKAILERGEEVIRELGLVAAKQETLFEQGTAVVMQPRTTAMAKSAVLDNFIIRGGLKAFHLHFNEEIYLLNEKQANEFSQRLFEKSREKLSKVKQIGFNDALALGSLTHNIAKG